jgi:hypothetical protein
MPVECSNACRGIIREGREQIQVHGKAIRSAARAAGPARTAAPRVLFFRQRRATGSRYENLSLR